MQTKILRSLILSFIWHLSLLVLTYWLLQEEPVIAPVTHATLEKTWVTLQQPPMPPVSKIAHPKSSVSRNSQPQAFGPKTASPKTSIKSLGVLHPVLQRRQTQSSLSGSDDHAKRKQRKPFDGYELADEIAIHQESVLYPFFQALWHRVDSILTYPKDFVQQRIQGKVTVQLFIDRRGVYSGKVLSMRGADLMLNTFVLATLVQALSAPLPEEFWMKIKDHTLPEKIRRSKGILTAFEFEFSLFGPGGIAKTKEILHFKNILYFLRDVYADPPLNQAIEKIWTRYIPPIIPVPGGFYIDFPRAIKLFQNLSNPDEDTLRERRLKLKQDEWKNIIRQSESPASSE